MSSPNLQALYARTSAGDTELESPSNGLSINQRKLLQWADGQTTVSEMAERLAAGHTVDPGKVVRDIERLQSTGLLSLTTGAPVSSSTTLGGSIGINTAAKKKSAVPVWAYGAGAVVIVVAGVALFGSRSGHTVQPGSAPTQASADQPQQPEEDSKILGVMPNPARWFSPAGPKPAEQPKPADQKPADKNQPQKPNTPPAVAAATPTPVKPTPVPAAAPTPAPVAVATPAPAPVATPAPAPVQVASAAPASKPVENKPVNTKPIFREQPQFPGEAARQGIDSGTVKARLSVDTSGHVTKVEILESKPHHVFDRAVQAALAKWRYEPPSAPFTTDAELDFKAE